MKNHGTGLLSALSLAVLTACGGGGGDSGSSDGGATTVSANLTTGNYEAASQAMVQVAMGTTSLTDYSNFSMATASGAHLLAKGVYGQARVAALAAPAAANGPVTVNCPNGGSQTVTMNIASSTVDTVGDSIAITMNDCVIDQDTLKGTISFSLTAVNTPASSDPDAYDNAMRVAFSGFSFLNAITSSVLSGTMDVHAVWQNATTGVDTISTSSLAVRETLLATQAVRTVSLGNYSAKTTSSAVSTSTVINGTVSDSAVGGSLAIATEVAFVTMAGNNYPSSGVATMTGANGAKARLTAVSATAVELGFDAAGDGTFEVVKPTTWVALDN